MQNVGRLSTLPSNCIKARPALWLIGFRTRPPSIRLFFMLRLARLILLGFLISISLPASLRAAGKPNIILITLDSTRADRIGFLGSHSALTPNLDGLAPESIIFERAYTQAPLTLVSHATILTGTYPQTHQVSELGSPLGAGLPYLPDLLHAHGYRTAAFVGSILLDPRNGLVPGFDRGFDLYDAGFQQSSGGGDKQLVERRADQVVARATKSLSKNTLGPFFLWVHLYDPHARYGRSYDRAVAAADAALGKLFAVLRAQKLFEDSIMVVASDHGESLGAHGEDTHGIFLYDATIHVPLLLKLPQNQMAGKRVKGRVRLVDVAPTVLEVAGVPVPSQMQGQSLLRIARTNPDADQPAYARSDFPQQAFGWSPLESWRAGKYLYIRAPKPELYDLSADPQATKNLAQTSKAILATLASQLEAFDSHFDGRGSQAETSGLSSSEAQKLASLGYVGLQKSSSNANPAVNGTDPKDTIALANEVLKALLNLSEGKPERAVPALQQVLAGQANMYLAQYGLGVALAQQRQYAKAVEHLHKAIELQPDSAWAHYEMAASLIKIGDFETAAVHLELASARLPKFREVHLLLAQSYEQLGKSKEAQVERKKASQ
jgi:arylsulfatase A-like enzyme